MDWLLSVPVWWEKIAKGLWNLSQLLVRGKKPTSRFLSLIEGFMLSPLLWSHNILLHLLSPLLWSHNNLLHLLSPLLWSHNNLLHLLSPLLWSHNNLLHLLSPLLWSHNNLLHLCSLQLSIHIPSASSSAGSMCETSGGCCSGNSYGSCCQIGFGQRDICGTVCNSSKICQGEDNHLLLKILSFVEKLLNFQPIVQSLSAC